MKVGVAILCCWAAVATAETRHVAIVVDAEDVSRAMLDVGVVARDDMFAVTGKGRAGLDEAVALAKQRIAAVPKAPDRRVVLVAYVAAQLDNAALGELRRTLAGLGADVRLELVDDRTTGPAQIRIDDGSEGEILVVANGGPSFAQHFVAALRGGFSLDDAYRRAYERSLGGGHHKGVAVAAPAEAPDNGTLLVAGGAGRGVTDSIGVMPVARGELRLPSGLTVAITGGSKHPAGYRESSTALLVGYRRGVARGVVAAWLGGEAGAGLVMQVPDLGVAAYSGAAILAPFAGASLRVAPQIAVALEGAVPASALQRDGKTSLVLLPAAWVGLAFDL